VFENRVLRRIFGPQREEVVGGWRRLHNLYASPNIIRVRMRWVGHVVCMRVMRNAYKVLAGKPERKRPLGTPKSRWYDNIRIDLRQMGGGVVD
jgi:hypothetical protein